MHEPVRLSYRLTEEEKVQVMQQKLRPRDVVRRAHDLRHGKHKRIAARPPKPSNIPTGWAPRWSESESSWYYWCPLTNVTCWDVSDCKHDDAAVQKVVNDKGGLSLDSPYVRYALRADAMRQQQEEGRAERIKERRRVQSAGPRRPQSAGGRPLSVRAQAGRPQSARAQPTGSTMRSSRVGPHPPSSSEAVIALRSATLSSAAAARAAAPRQPRSRDGALAHAVVEAKEAPWMLGHPAEKYGRMPSPARQAQLWDQMKEAGDKENPAFKARPYGTGPGYRKHCMRIDAPDAVHELQDLESRDWRMRSNPGLPREYLHVRPKHQRKQISLQGEDAEAVADTAAFKPGDHVWLAVDPTARLKNGSGLFDKPDPEEPHLGPFSRRTQSNFEQVKDGILTKPTGVVKTVQDSSGDCLVEWGVVGYCPAGMSRKLLWCTPDELKKVPTRKKIVTAARNSLLMRTMSTTNTSCKTNDNEP